MASRMTSAMLRPDRAAAARNASSSSLGRYTCVFSMYVNLETYLTYVNGGSRGRPLADYCAETIWGPAGLEANAYWVLESEGGLEWGGFGISACLRDVTSLPPADYIVTSKLTEQRHVAHWACHRCIRVAQSAGSSLDGNAPPRFQGGIFAVHSPRRPLAASVGLSPWCVRPCCPSPIRHEATEGIGGPCRQPKTEKTTGPRRRGSRRRASYGAGRPHREVSTPGDRAR